MSGKNKKHNRNKLRSPSAKAYLAQNRYEKNKAKKLAKHRKAHPNDGQCTNTAIVNYKLIKLELKKQKELDRERRWKSYLNGKV
jgi:hypothetical protein